MVFEPAAALPPAPTTTRPVIRSQVPRKPATVTTTGPEPACRLPFTTAESFSVPRATGARAEPLIGYRPFTSTVTGAPESSPFAVPIIDIVPVTRPARTRMENVVVPSIAAPWIIWRSRPEPFQVPFANDVRVAESAANALGTSAVASAISRSRLPTHRG